MIRGTYRDPNVRADLPDRYRALVDAQSSLLTAQVRHDQGKR